MTQINKTMEKQLQIIVAGTANVGKSTMMLQLEKWLKDNGYEVELSFENHPDYSGENSYFFRQKEEQYFPEKVEAIKAETKIVLKEAQLSEIGFYRGNFQTTPYI
jgi:GTPase SAR1 family protein